MSKVKPWREYIGKHDAYMIMCDVLDVLGEKEAIKKTVYERLKQVPSADAVQVVRCKDCKHRSYADNRIPYERDWVCDWWRKDGCDEKGFCSYGERKEG